MTWSSLWSCDSSYPPSPDVFSGGNCRYSSSNSNNGFGATRSFLSGKWYWEVYIVANGNKQLVLGLVTPETKDVATQLWNTVGVYGVASGSGVGYKLIENSPGFVEIDGFDDVANGDIVQLAFDRDNYKLWVGRNNTWLESGDPAGDSNPLISGSDFAFQGGAVMPIIGQGSGSTFTMVLNAGQDDTFGGEITAAGNADGNGFGVFKYAPPTGFLAPCSANLPISADVDPAETDSDYPAKQLNVVNWTGTGTAQSITGVGFAPDLVWLKRRDATADHQLLDTTRGATYAIESSTTANSSTAVTDGLTAFGTDGFTLGTNTDYNGNTNTYTAWCWGANGGTTSTNTSGTITSTVQANTAAGFSIVKWRSNNSANQTIGHGLSKAPRFIISKPYSASTWSWHNFHHYLGSIGKFNFAGSATGAFGSGTNTYGAMPSSTVFTVGTAGNLMPNNSTTDVISYCWHDVDGLQKFGIYKGNGNADGPFVYLGFRPRLFVQKRADSTGAWRVWDSERHPLNTNDAIFRWGTNGAEDTANGQVDFLSNGVKIRMTYAEMNADGGTFIYMAWGDVPFKYNNTF